MAEYIFNVDQVLYDDDTKSLVAKSEYVGELIRCKNCQHYVNVRNRLTVNESFGECERFGLYTYSEWYCGNAERREDD